MKPNELFIKIQEDLAQSIKDAAKHCYENIICLNVPLKTSSELMSYFIGHFIQTTIEKKYPDIKVLVGKSDNDHDVVLVVNGKKIPLEIKVTCSTQWRGGEFSHRDCDYLMVNWKFNEKTEEFKMFACISNLDKSNWTSNIHNGYYATSLHKMELAQDENRIDVLGGMPEWKIVNGKKYVTMESEQIKFY